MDFHSVVSQIWEICEHDDDIVGQLAACNPTLLQLQMLRTLRAVRSFLRSGGEQTKNSISLLYERCAPLIPSFEIQNAGHQTFLAVCRLGDAQTSHEGSSKQQAKAGAAQAMLHLLHLG